MNEMHELQGKEKSAVRDRLFQRHSEVVRAADHYFDDVMAAFGRREINIGEVWRPG